MTRNSRRGTEHRTEQLTRGDRARDRDDDDAELVVVAVADETAAEYQIDSLDATVAEANPRYDNDDEVVEAVYLDDLERNYPTWRSVEDVDDAVGFDAVKKYAFPASRLAREEVRR